MSDLEFIVKRKLAQLLDIDVDRIALDAHLYREHGLTSLKLVLLVTSLCAETGASVFNFTDRDIAGPKTARDFVALFATATGQGDLTWGDEMAQTNREAPCTILG